MAKILLEKMPLLMPSVQDSKKAEYISELYEKLIIRNTYYQEQMKCIGAGKVTANERAKSLLTGEGHSCILHTGIEKEKAHNSIGKLIDMPDRTVPLRTRKLED